MKQIYVDTLLNTLNQMYKKPESSEDYMTIGYDHAIADAIITVFKQPTIEESEWIPVIERMPEERRGYDSRLVNKFPMVSSKCLATVSEGDSEFRFVDLCHTINGKWFSDTLNHFIPEDDWEVLAWKDASEPWKGDEDA